MLNHFHPWEFCAHFSLLITNVVVRPVLVFLIITRHPQVITIRKPWKKNKICYPEVLKVTWQMCGHIVRSWVERERSRSWARGSFIGVEDGGLGYYGFPLY